MKLQQQLNATRHEHQSQRLRDKSAFDAFCISVCDGDTIQVARHYATVTPLCGGAPSHIEASGVEFVRLASIDAPELRALDARPALWSQEYLARLIQGKIVTVWPRRIWRDPYHRIIASVTYEGLDLATCLIREGHAVARPSRRKC